MSSVTDNNHAGWTPDERRREIIMRGATQLFKSLPSDLAEQEKADRAADLAARMYSAIERGEARGIPLVLGRTVIFGDPARPTAAIRLSASESAALTHLLASPGQAVRWTAIAPTERGANEIVRRLRNRLGDMSRISTVRGVGPCWA